MLKIIYTIEYEPGWETTEDGGDHVYVDKGRLIKARHSVGYCPEDCPLIGECDD